MENNPLLFSVKSSDFKGESNYFDEKLYDPYPTPFYISIEDYPK